MDSDSDDGLRECDLKLAVFEIDGRSEKGSVYLWSSVAKTDPSSSVGLNESHSLLWYVGGGW